MEKGYLWLVVVASLNSVVSLFYYLTLIKRMYIGESEAPTAKLTIAFPVKAVLLIACVGIFWLGVMPGSLLNAIGAMSSSVFP